MNHKDNVSKDHPFRLSNEKTARDSRTQIYRTTFSMDEDDDAIDIVDDILEDKYSNSRYEFKDVKRSTNQSAATDRRTRRPVAGAKNKRTLGGTTEDGNKESSDDEIELVNLRRSEKSQKQNAFALTEQKTRPRYGFGEVSYGTNEHRFENGVENGKIDLIVDCDYRSHCSSFI